MERKLEGELSSNLSSVRILALEFADSLELFARDLRNEAPRSDTFLESNSAHQSISRVLEYVEEVLGDAQVLVQQLKDSIAELYGESRQVDQSRKSDDSTGVELTVTFKKMLHYMKVLHCLNRLPDRGEGVRSLNELIIPLQLAPFNLDDPRATIKGTQRLVQDNLGGKPRRGEYVIEIRKLEPQMSEYVNEFLTQVSNEETSQPT